MAEPLPGEHIDDLVGFISSPRFETYLRATDGDRERASALYAWNTEISAAFYTPLQFAEIGTRNGAVEAITAEFGDEWHRSRGFQLAIRERVGKHLRPRRDLSVLLERFTAAGGVVAELKFAFWQHLFVAAQDSRLWNRHMRNAFPGIPLERSVVNARQQIHDDIQAIRSLRNRIAHHEPIITRPLANDLACAVRLSAWRRPAIGNWLQAIEGVTPLLNNRP